MKPSRVGCKLRAENGNCLCIGGFCTAVNDDICFALQSAYEKGMREKWPNGLCTDYARDVAVEAANRIDLAGWEFMMTQGFIQMFGLMGDELTKIRIALEHMSGGKVVAAPAGERSSTDDES